MQKITTIADLKSAIEDLEYKQASELVLLKDEFHATTEKLRPINIVKNTFHEMIHAPDLKTSLINTVIGITTGFLSKKILLGQTHNPLSKLMGYVVEMVVANKVTKNADVIKSIGSVILKKIINRKSDSEKEQSDSEKA